MTDELEGRIAAQRAALESTLDAIEYKLNVPKQLDRFAGKAKTAYSKNPVPFIVGATATAVAVVGVVAWALVSKDE